MQPGDAVIFYLFFGGRGTFFVAECFTIFRYSLFGVNNGQNGFFNKLDMLALLKRPSSC